MKTHTILLVVIVILVAITNPVFASPKNHPPYSLEHWQKIVEVDEPTISAEFYNPTEPPPFGQSIMRINFHSIPIMATERIKTILSDITAELNKLGDIKEKEDYPGLNSIIETFTPRLMKSGAKIVTIDLPRLSITIALIPKK